MVLESGSYDVNAVNKLHQSRSPMLRVLVAATLLALVFAGGTAVAAHKTVTLSVDGAEKSCDGFGDGPVDAAFNCIKELFPHNTRLQLYQVSAVTQGTDAQAEVTVRLEEDGKTVNGQGADTDTMVASVKAYVHALNKLLVKREKTAPAALSA